MIKKRIVARVDIKNEFVIKGIHLEGLRKVGDPNELAQKYYQAGVDEIVFMDAVAAYYDRNSLSEIIEKACENVFVPMTVGGGIRSIEDIQTALNSGADKVAINTRAVQNPQFISDAAKIFGSQCIVASVEAKKTGAQQWEAYVDNGREPTGLDVLEWVKELERLGAGEILVTSIDAEGTRKGFDLQLNEAVADAVSLPVIGSGGAGKFSHIEDLCARTNLSGIALASVLHYNLLGLKEIKASLTEAGVVLRK